MARRKVTIDPTNEHVQVCGKYRLNTELKGEHILSSVSKRKTYPDVLSRGRKETDIREAIDNYNAELNAQIEEIRAKIRGQV